MTEPNLTTMSPVNEKQVYRIGPRELGVECAQCDAAATYLLGTPYDLTPGGEVAKPACGAHAVGYPQWQRGGAASALPTPGVPER